MNIIFILLCVFMPVYCFNMNIGSTGLLFPYTLGTLAYIKTYIKPNNYNFVGISGGSWCSLIYHFEKNISDHDFLWSILVGNRNHTVYMLNSNSMKEFQEIVARNMKNRYKNKDISKLPLTILTTKIGKNINNIKVDKFNDIDELINYCLCSSYIPFISGKSAYMIYKNEKYIDGELFKNNNNLLKNGLYVDKNLWNRKFTWKERLYLDYNQSEKLFNHGWNDAKKYM